MNSQLLKSLLGATTLGACLILSANANAAGLHRSTVPGDKYGYQFHLGKRDPFTDGANVNSPRNPYSDGGSATGRRDAFTDGAHGTGVDQSLAGLDRSGVSAPPAHGTASGAIGRNA